MAAATAARRSGSVSAASRAPIPAWIFSHTRGTPKNAVGRTATIAGTSPVAASGQKCTCQPLSAARYRVNMRSAMWASGR